MSQQNAKRLVKGAKHRWITFLVLVFSGGIAFKLSSIKDMFYVPLQEYMGLSHTQIGGAMSVYGIVQTVGLIFGIYLCDRFSKKYMIGFSLLGIACCGVYLATFPNYTGFLLTFAVMAIFGEVTYWPVLLKAVRLLGTEEEQGRLFGFLEMGRGVIDVIVASAAVGVFKAMNGDNDPAGLKAGLLFLAGMTALAGVLCLIFVPHDEIRTTNKEGVEVGKAKAAFEGMLDAIKSPEIWLVAINGFTVYAIYCGLTYFIPFLNQIYMLPATMVGMYGIINQYALKMIGGPVGGYFSDKVTHSAAKYIRWAFLVAAIAMGIFMFLPHEKLGAQGKWGLGMVATLCFGAIIFTMRAVFFAPMDEVRVPARITGAAMSLGCLIIYLPNAFAYLMYGSMLDRFPGMKGFRIVFSIMLAWAVLGLVISTLLIRKIKQRQAVVDAPARE